MATITPRPLGGAPGTDNIDLGESVAGEEDPGASIDMDDIDSSGRPDQHGRGQPTGASPPMSPGDQAPAGTPGTGEDVCPECGGSGKQGDQDCPNCQGTGRVIVGIGGA